MLSDTARYAMRAMMALAERHPRPAAIGEIAEAITAPRKYLEAVMLRLKREGLLVSSRGRTGGYALARPATEISVADIIRSTDGPLALTPCASRTRFEACENCVDVTTCSIRFVLLEGRDALAEVLERRTLADLASTPDLSILPAA
jgi:Rrf2 family protein